jgi:hypothetical protein
MMKIDTIRFDEPTTINGEFRLRGVRARGVVENKAVAIFVPWDTPDDQVAVVGRPLLVAAFARGEWYEIGAAAVMFTDEAPKYREPIIVAE